MNTQYLDAYLAAWQVHCAKPDEGGNGMAAAADSAIRYSDINLPEPFIGHSGIREMCRLASGILPGAILAVQERACVGLTWATKWALSGLGGAKRVPFRIEGASWGSLGEDGKVQSQRDYWNPSHFKDQVGSELFTST